MPKEENNKKPLNNNEAWRYEYRQNRYMQYVTDDELKRRFDDVFKNMTLLTDDGKIGLHPISSEGVYWMRLFTHLLEEIVLRGKGMPHGDLISPETIPKPTFPEKPKALCALGENKYTDGDHLFKYGKKIHLKRMYENGTVRISPASFYNDASLNAAIKDDERILSVFHHPEKIKITHVDKKTGEDIELTPVSNVESTFNVSTNYYVYCMADSYSLRLFDDFESDACIIIIHDMYGFLRKLEKAFKRSFGDWGFGAEQVKYIDPLNPPNENDIDVFFCKHFRYSYQKEIRAVWLPSSAVEKLDPIYLDIGSMEEYADYVEF